MTSRLHLAELLGGSHVGGHEGGSACGRPLPAFRATMLLGNSRGGDYQTQN